MRYPNFCGGSAQAASLSFQNERTVNWFVERAQSPSAKSPAALLPTPGFTRWALSAYIGGRAAIFADGRLFFVMGGKLCEYDVNGTETVRGSVAQDGNPAQIVYNGPVGGQLLVASGGNAYCLVLATNTFTQVLAGKATMIAYCKGYFLAFELATGKVYLSNPNDGTTWSLTTFFQRSDFADRWQAMFVDGNNLVWLPGTDSFEVWSLSNPSSTQPFAPLSGLVGGWGIAAPFAFAVRPTPRWLSRNPEGAGLVVRVGGSGAEPISTYALANVLSMYARTKSITDAEVVLYQDGGHSHFTVNFPTANASWTQTDDRDWCERGAWNAPRQDYDLWPARCHVYAFGKHLVGDRSTGTIWQMDASFATDVNGQGVRRLRRAPALFDEDVRRPIDQLLLKCDVGLGLQGDEAVTQGVNPLVMCRASRDGGLTFGNERQASFGRIGEYRRRVYWNRWGVLEDAAFEVTCSEPVPLRIVDAFINPTQKELVA